ncbi:hypothetical protein [Tabrizicola sp.]|uniref:hypothetical protein n=1 Tax=Tabrizicola sp. TaxID=2005166 RepID=UPI003F2E9E93
MRQYFHHRELEFSAHPLTYEALKIHHVSDYIAHQFIKAGYICACVDFDEDGKVVGAGVECNDDAYLHFGDRIASEALGGKLKPLLDQPVPPASWIRDQDGLSQFGGAPPEGFVMPKASFMSGYQYIGRLSRNEPGLERWGADIHLIYPMFLDHHPHLFLDLENPLAPKLFGLDVCRRVKLWDGGGAYGPGEATFFTEIRESEEIASLFNGDEEVRYKPESFRRVPLREEDVVGDDVYNCNASYPIWLQAPEIPICPRTGKVMEFIGEFLPGNPPEASPLIKRAKRELKEFYFDWYFYGVAFWGANNSACVFGCPEGKSLCIHPQTT